MFNFKLISILFFVFLSLINTKVFAGISIEPFASVSSTKQIKPDKAGKNKTSTGTETEVIKQRTTYGIRGSIGFFRILKLQAGVGTNQLTTTSKTSQAADDYNEIDYNKDLSMDTSDPDKEVKITETQKKATAVLVFDPGFWIFILRGKAGVVATQRELTKETNDGAPASKYTSPITYKPTCGAGAGIRLGAGTYFMAEYNLFLYKFPEKAPFEREVTVSIGASI